MNKIILLIISLFIGNVANTKAMVYTDLPVNEQWMVYYMFNDPLQQRKFADCVLDPVLVQAAKQKVEDQMLRDYTAHVDPDGHAENWIVRQLGYQLPSFYDADGVNNISNLYWGSANHYTVFVAWKNSPNHIGRMFGQGSFFQQQTHYGLYMHPISGYWCLMFAHAPVNTPTQTPILNASLTNIADNEVSVVGNQAYLDSVVVTNQTTGEYFETSNANLNVLIALVSGNNVIQVDGYKNNVIVLTKTLNTVYTKMYTVTTTTTGSGTVTPTTQVAEGSTVSITATPAQDCQFLNWSGNASLNSTISITVNSNIELVANFSNPPVFTANFASNTGGTVSKATFSGVKNSHTIVTATPNSGFVFNEWNDGVTTATRTIVLTANIDLVASFTQLPVFTANFASNGNGSVSKSTFSGTNNSQTTVTATPNSGFVFLSWSDGVTTATRTIVLTENIDLIANFSTANINNYSGLYLVTLPFSIDNNIVNAQVFAKISGFSYTARVKIAKKTYRFKGVVNQSVNVKGNVFKIELDINEYNPVLFSFNELEAEGNKANTNLAKNQYNVALSNIDLNGHMIAFVKNNRTTGFVSYVGRYMYGNKSYKFAGSSILYGDKFSIYKFHGEIDLSNSVNSIIFHQNEKLEAISSIWDKVIPEFTICNYDETNHSLIRNVNKFTFGDMNGKFIVSKSGLITGWFNAFNEKAKTSIKGIIVNSRGHGYTKDKQVFIESY